MWPNLIKYGETEKNIVPVDNAQYLPSTRRRLRGKK